MNIKLYYIFSFLRNFVPIYPVYLLLFESKGLSLSQISLLLAIWSVPLVLLEVPTGILADKWSRKNMIVIGSFLHAACFALWYFSEGFLLYAAGFVLWGISEAFCSGSVEALLYDSLKQHGQESKFDQVYGRGSFYSSVSVAVSGLTGGFIAMTLGMKYTLALSVLFLLLCAFLTTRFIEVNYFKQNHRPNDGTELKHIYITLRDAATLLLSNRGLLIVALLSILVIGTAGMLDEYDQLIASGYGLNLGLVGVWVGFRYILEGIGSGIAYKLRSLLTRMGIKDQFVAIWIICLFAAVSLGISGLTGSILLMPLYGIFYLVMASARILHEDYVQQKIEEQGRSTVHSLISLADNVYGVGFFGLFALILSGNKVFSILVIVAAYILSVCVLLGVMYYRCRKQATF